jgi:hypothetical protein
VIAPSDKKLPQHPFHMKMKTGPVFKTLRYYNPKTIGNTRHITDDCIKDRPFEPCSRHYHMSACYSAVCEVLAIGPTVIEGVLLNVETNSDATESASEHETK